MVHINLAEDDRSLIPGRASHAPRIPCNRRDQRCGLLEVASDSIRDSRSRPARSAVAGFRLCETRERRARRVVRGQESIRIDNSRAFSPINSTVCSDDTVFRCSANLYRAEGLQVSILSQSRSLKAARSSEVVGILR